MKQIPTPLLEDSKTTSYTLFDYQKDAVNYIIKNKYVMLADEMGLGKTVQALAVSNELNAKTLIVCPAFLKPNWKNEITKFSGSRKEFFDIISYGAVNKVGKEDRPDLVVVDESHYLKNPKAKRTIDFFNFIRDVRPRRLLLMTGTPIMNRVPEVFTSLRLLSMGNSSKSLNMGYWEFAHTFSIAKSVRTPYGTATKFEGIRNVELLKSYLQGKYIRRTNDAVELPELVEKYFTANSKQLEHQKEILEELINKSTPNLSYISTKKKIMATAKISLTIKYVKEMVEQGEQVVVFSDHIEPAIEIANSFGADGVSITGKDSIQHRGQTVDRFQNGEIKVISATIKSLGVGVTLTKARHLVFNDYPFVPADLDQAMKRIHRIGQNKTCFIHYILSNILDRNILKLIKDKRSTIEKVI